MEGRRNIADFDVDSGLRLLSHRSNVASKKSGSTIPPPSLRRRLFDSSRVSTGSIGAKERRWKDPIKAEISRDDKI